MGSKFTFFIVACVHLCFKLQNTHSHPIFGYVFGNDDTKEAETAELSDLIETVDGGNNKMIVEAAKKVETTPKSPESVTGSRNKLVNTSLTENTRKETKTEPPGNRGFGARSVGLAARLLGRGINGVRQVVDGSTNLAASAIDGVEMVANSTVDGAQEIIDSGMKRAVNRISTSARILDAYRKSLSAGSMKNADQAHSLTLTTSSKAPTQFLTNLYNEYAGGVSSSSVTPEITGLDLSNWSFW